MLGEDGIRGLQTAIKKYGTKVGGKELEFIIASTDGKKPRCAGSTVVMIATCGRTSRVRFAISPEWFMPSSKTP